MRSAKSDASGLRRKRLLLLVGNDALLDLEARFVNSDRWRVACVRDGLQALHQFEVESPALLVIAGDLPPGPNGLEVCRSLKERSSTSAAIILLTAVTVEARLSAFEARADDCMHHPVDVRELAARANALALRCALPPLLPNRNENAAPHSARSAAVLLDRVSAFSRGYGLSPQQTQILTLLATGVPLKLIGAQLGCGHATVRTHLHRIAVKLGCSGAREILARLLSCDPN